MDGRFNNAFSGNQEESENTSDNSGDGDSPFISSSSVNRTSTQKRSRRTVQKRVVTIPIGGEVEGSRIKGDGAPPYDSWAWRKYGQKPIKGSPYPRGYYRCSSSKGCPARKQVERSRVDPSMLVITYACDHNHSGPPSRISNSNYTTAAATSTTTTNPSSSTPPTSPKSESKSESAIFIAQSEAEENKFTTDEFTWFSDVASTPETVLESPIYREGEGGEEEMVYPTILGEEDESLFADLGELPECSVVFERGFLLDQERRRQRCSLRAG